MTKTLANPFIVGEIVTDETSFIDREKELHQLTRDLADSQKIFLLSPRRYGKTSLVTMAFRRLEREHQIRTVMIPVGSSATYTQFLERFSTSVTRAAGPYDKVKGWIQEFLQSVRPELTIDPQSGQPQFTLGSQKTPDPRLIAPEIFNLPETIARHSGVRLAICLDEFQQIQAYDGQSIEHCLRDAIQVQRHVGYVFAGSQPSMIEPMLGPKRPFYRSGTRRFLEKIPRDAWEAFIPGRFAAIGVELTTAGLLRLLEHADDVPLDVQRIAHELWDGARDRQLRVLDIAHVDEVTDRVVNAESPVYQRMWQQRPTGQRLVFQALAAGETKGLQSMEVRRRYRLGAHSTVQKALALLRQADIIDQRGEKYFFLEPLFAHWIRRNL